MKKILLGIICLFFITGNALASTLTWDRNTETDMKDYQVYGCFVAGCTVQQVSPLGTVTQPATGIPTFVIDLTGKEGRVAISARDNFGNESGLSVQVPFDFAAPKIPTNPALK